VLLEESVAAGAVDLAALFGNARPVEVEIGTGKGTFLLARAAARQEVNFLGIEWARAYCLYAADRIRRAELANVRMLRADAGAFFRDCLADGSVGRVHVYFPDPWPKRRHHSRRLIQPPFLAQARRVLKIGGQLIVVTDHLDYFRHIQGTLLAAEGFARVSLPPMSDRDGEIVGTNFERKYIAQGRPFYSVALMRYA
jgi:tRNA (guanine-N7-)-methyltransferase